MVAILLATYNGEKFLIEQLNSIINQSYEDWTLYIHDDGSSDGTIAIINQYCDQYENIIYLPDLIVHRGAAQSFMWLLEQVNADYYMFCDQDDVWLPYKIEKTYIAMQEKPVDSPVLIFSDLVVVDSDLNIINKSFWFYSKLEKLVNNSNYLKVLNYVTGCTMMINEKAKLVSLRNKCMCMHDSWIAMCVLANKGVIYPINEKMTLYKQHEKNVLGAAEYHFPILNMLHSMKENINRYSVVNKIINMNLFVYLYYRICVILKRLR